MAKQKAKRPETKSVTLATGTKVTGPVAAVNKMVTRARQEARNASTPNTEQAVSNEPPEGTPLTSEESARTAANEASPELTSTPATTAPERPSRGASLAAWADFAKAAGFEHDEKASRDEIRDAYEAAHPAG